MCSGNGVDETETEPVSGRKMDLVQDTLGLGCPQDIQVESVINKCGSGAQVRSG